MIEAGQGKVNAFDREAPPASGEADLRIRTLTCLLQLGRLIEAEDHVDSVRRRVPDLVAEGLGPAYQQGVKLSLGGFTFHSTWFVESPHVVRKKILSHQQPVGEIEVHLPETAGSLRPEQWDLLAGVAERMARFHERKNLQSALERSEQRYQRLFRQARDGIVLVDADTAIILDANESFLDLVGGSLDDLQTCKLWEIIAPEEREQFQEGLERVIAESERPWQVPPIVATTRLGRQIEVTCSMLHFIESDVLQCICRDITERQMLTHRIAESENRYRAIFESTPVAMMSCDTYGKVLDVNASLLSRFYGAAVAKEALVGQHILELGLCDLQGRQVEFMQFLRGVCVQMRDVPILESPYRRAGYAHIRGIPLLDAQNKVILGLVIIEDITEVREAQRAMLQSAKMAAVGQMMAGFAHEIGTPLGIISANAQYLLKDWEGKPGAEELRVILHETNRITNLVQKLLVFSRPAAFKLAPASVNDLIREVVEMLKYQEILRTVEIEQDFAPDLPLIPLDATLIKQVFFNLIINAGQAMPNGGRLTLATRLVKPLAGGRSKGPYIEAEITDTGMGISPSNLRKIFLPFFTTKEPGKGTGLGLSMSYRTVQNHGGTIVAESRGEGRGATFRVFLPVAGPSDNQTETAADWMEPIRQTGGNAHA